MNLILTESGAVAGFAAGLAMRGEVVRLSVRGGEPEQAACGDCAFPLPRLVALRCAGCGHWLGPPAAIESATAAVLALLLARFGGQPVVTAFAYLGIVGVALSQIDVAVQRLPDRLTLPAYPATVLLLALAAAAADDWTAFTRALLGGLAVGTGYLLLAAISGGQLGGGDVKLAGLTGLVLGWLGWRTVLAGAFAGFLLAAIASLGLLALGRAGRRSAISFGPYMLAGALVAMLATATAPR